MLPVAAIPPREGRRAARLAGLLALALAAAWVAAARAAEGELPLPRFVSLRSNEVNLRTGPGTGYPVEWVYQRRRLPVEVIAEFDTWRKIRDWQGTVGWVHQSMLDGRRTARVTDTERVLRRSPDDHAPAVARLEPGVIGDLLACEPEWCRLDVKGYRGWLRRDEFWGAYEGETIE
jgi:SH3-like domain-containing protein